MSSSFRYHTFKCPVNTVLFWVAARRAVVISYQRFGTSYQSRKSWLLKMGTDHTDNLSAQNSSPLKMGTNHTKFPNSSPLKMGPIIQTTYQPRILHHWRWGPIIQTTYQPRILQHWSWDQSYKQHIGPKFLTLADGTDHTFRVYQLVLFSGFEKPF